MEVRKEAIWAGCKLARSIAETKTPGWTPEEFLQGPGQQKLEPALGDQLQEAFTPRRVGG
jgi:hypothetical protein